MHNDPYPHQSWVAPKPKGTQDVLVMRLLKGKVPEQDAARMPSRARSSVVQLRRPNICFIPTLLPTTARRLTQSRPCLTWNVMFGGRKTGYLAWTSCVLVSRCWRPTDGCMGLHADALVVASGCEHGVPTRVPRDGIHGRRSMVVKRLDDRGPFTVEQVYLAVCHH